MQAANPMMAPGQMYVNPMQQQGYPQQAAPGYPQGQQPQQGYKAY